MIHRKVTVYCAGVEKHRHAERELCALVSYLDASDREWWTADARADHQPVDVSDYLTPDVLHRLAPIGGEPHTIDEQADMLGGLSTRFLIGCGCGLNVEIGDWLGRGFDSARDALVEVLEGRTPRPQHMPGHVILTRWADAQSDADGASRLLLSVLDRMLTMR